GTDNHEKDGHDESQSQRNTSHDEKKLAQGKSNPPGARNLRIIDRHVVGSSCRRVCGRRCRCRRGVHYWWRWGCLLSLWLLRWCHRSWCYGNFRRCWYLRGLRWYRFMGFGRCLLLAEPCEEIHCRENGFSVLDCRGDLAGDFARVTNQQQCRSVLSEVPVIVQAVVFQHPSKLFLDDPVTIVGMINDPGYRDDGA